MTEFEQHADCIMEDSPPSQEAHSNIHANQINQEINQPTIDMMEAMDNIVQQLAKRNEALLESMGRQMQTKFSSLAESFMKDFEERNAQKTSADSSSSVDHNTVKAVGLEGDYSSVRGTKDRSTDHNIVRVTIGQKTNAQEDDKLSLAAPSESAASRAFDKQSRKGSATSSRSNSVRHKRVTESSRHSSAHSSAHSIAAAQAKEAENALEKEQEYWTKQVSDYDEKQDLGPEVVSTIAGASKIFWQKAMSSDRLKRRQKLAKFQLTVNIYKFDRLIKKYGPAPPQI